MALPASATPHVRTARRYLWLAERARLESDDDGPALAFRARRLAAPGTPLPATFPSRAALAAAGVLAVEEVLGAGVGELTSYGLTTRAAEALIRWLERYSMNTFSNGPRTGQFYEEDDVTLLASAARAASGESDVYEVGDKGTLRLDLDVTAASGTLPTLHVQVETRPAYGTGDWTVVDAFPLRTGTGAVRRTMGGLDRFVRVVYTLGGTSPSFTFSVTGQAV